MPIGSPVVPTLVSFLICDQIIDDKFTNKKSAIGIFNTIIVPSVPSQVQQISVLASLSELNGRCEVELRFVHDSDDSVHFSGRGQVEAPDPLAVVDLVFSLQGLRIPVPGQYAFEMLAGGELLGRRRFHVLLRPPQAT